jgi:hypothetical protein
VPDHEEIHEDVVFNVPAPPFPPPPGEPRIMFLRSRGTGEGDAEHEDIMLRKVPKPVAGRFRAAAGARGLTHAQYLAALVSLHESLRALADGGNETARAELEKLGLTSVTV